MVKWYRLLNVASGTVTLDGRAVEKQCSYIAQWQTAEHTTIYNKWHTYANSLGTWEQAYAVLKRHANPAALAVWFVGTF